MDPLLITRLKWKNSSSIARMVTRLRAGQQMNSGSIPGSDRSFLVSRIPRSGLRVTYTRIQRATEPLKPEVKRPKRVIYQFHHQGSEAKNKMRCTSTPPTPSWRARGRLYLFQ
jgi:hypothetical protein